MKSLSSKGSHDVNFIGYFTAGNTRKPLSLWVCVRVKREGVWECVRREGVCKEGGSVRKEEGVCEEGGCV